MLSQAVEDYLKVIYEIQQERGKVTTSALAEKLNVAPASVTGMLKKLAEFSPRLVNYERHHGVSLTPAGDKIALEVIRHHRLIESYLHTSLGYTWDKVDEEAEHLEHVISEEFEDRIAEALGHPQVDPHGDPIPAKNGHVAATIAPRLTDLEPGQRGRICRVRDDDPALLRYLGELGLRPDARVQVTDKSPFEGPIHVRVGEGGSPHALGRQVTDQIFIEVSDG